MHRLLIAIIALSSSVFAITHTQAETSSQPKEWTFLIYLNGNNNLDSYGKMNLNQMEKVGSTDKINVVVQWASLSNGKTVRMLMTRDNDTVNVSSPIVEDLGKVDMGDYHSIIDFVKWGSRKYPAKHYFVDIWDHGSGWHFKPQDTLTKDISWDEVSGNHVTTEQLSTALLESSKILGQKIDIYASDACLMAMLEVANQVNDSVGVFLGSEETEPADGWPYDALLTGWNKLPSTASAIEVAKVLTQEYTNYYKQKPGSKVTLSAFDLNFLTPLNQSLKKFAANFKGLSAAELKKVNKAAKKATHFATIDYVDLGDFMSKVKSLKISKLDKSLFSEIDENANRFIVANNTIGFPKAAGAAVWIPTESMLYERYADRYSQLRFDSESHWGDVAKLISQSSN